VQTAVACIHQVLTDHGFQFMGVDEHQLTQENIQQPIVCEDIDKFTLYYKHPASAKELVLMAQTQPGLLHLSAATASVDVNLHTLAATILKPPVVFGQASSSSIVVSPETILEIQQQIGALLQTLQFSLEPLSFGNAGVVASSRLESEALGPLNLVQTPQSSRARVGQIDLDPLAATLDNLRQGGMQVGFDHPMFDVPSNTELGDESIPFSSVPPGANFDPVGPFGNPRLDRRGNPSRGGFPGGEPNPDAFIPPGGFGGFHPF